jgi:hypothetical protein
MLQPTVKHDAYVHRSTTMFQFRSTELTNFFSGDGEKGVQTDDLFPSSEKQFLIMNRLRQLKITDQVRRLLPSLREVTESAGCDLLCRLQFMKKHCSSQLC